MLLTGEPLVYLMLISTPKFATPELNLASLLPTAFFVTFTACCTLSVVFGSAYTSESSSRFLLRLFLTALWTVGFDWRFFS